jgi:chromate reductase, NAD(P)H dehydrogenase (quinone)
MANKPRILAFSGSTREGSYNKKMLKIAVEGARNAGAEVMHIDLKDYPMPLYDGDLEKEKGVPENAKKIFDLMLEHQGLLIASPEYNSGISGVLKNAIDWISRPVPDKKPLAAFDGKVAAIMGASTGAMGALRGLAALRSILSNIKVLVLPTQIGLPKAHEAFDDHDNLKEEKKKHNIEELGHKLAETVKLIYR